MRLAGPVSLGLVLALAGCGGATSAETQPAAIPSSVADELAARSDSIAAAWTTDPCGAAQEADDLRHAVDEAIKSGEIPAAYQDELEAAAVNLQNTANCPEEHGDEGEDHGKGKEKGKGHDKPDGAITTDTVGTTDTNGTTTEESG